MLLSPSWGQSQVSTKRMLNKDIGSKIMVSISLHEYWSQQFIWRSLEWVLMKPCVFDQPLEVQKTHGQETLKSVYFDTVFRWLAISWEAGVVQGSESVLQSNWDHECVPYVTLPFSPRRTETRERGTQQRRRARQQSLASPTLAGSCCSFFHILNIISKNKLFS